MNLAIRGIAGQPGRRAPDTFFKDQHPDLKADFHHGQSAVQPEGMARGNELTKRPRWAGYEVPPTGKRQTTPGLLHMAAPS